MTSFAVIGFRAGVCAALALGATACGKRDQGSGQQVGEPRGTAAPPAPIAAPPVPVAAPPAAAPPAIEPRDQAPADWTSLPLAGVKGASFKTHGVLRVPPGTTAAGDRASSGADAYAMATLTLPTGQHVLLIERAPAALESPDQLVQFDAQLGQKIDQVRRGPTWFVIATVQGSGLAATGESWGARPGVSCGVQEVVDRATLDTVVRLCGSLAPAP